MIRPILFSGPMVRAILEGRKTQTRRVLNPQIVCLPGITPTFSWGKFSGLFPDDWFGYGNEIDGGLPYQPGDILWVRETWQYYDWTEDGEPFLRFQADDARALVRPTEDWADRIDDIWYDLSQTANGQTDNRASDRRWRLGIHMPRWASRLTLEVTGVRVQRLQDISCGDAMDEGCPFPNMAAGPNPCDWFADLWNSINEKRGFGWGSNPWVAAISFNVHKQNVDALLAARSTGEE